MHKLASIRRGIRRIRQGNRAENVNVQAEDGPENDRLVYEHLEHKDSIRLLSLEPAQSIEAELHASFFHARLEDAPRYEAISYTWGAEIFPETLNFPAGCCKITANLASALKTFRLPDRERVLWADAVCINQAENVEKSRQVAMMGEIYKSASTILIWLGEGDERTKYAVRGFQILADELRTSSTSMLRYNSQVLGWIERGRKRDQERDGHGSSSTPEHSKEDNFEEDFAAALDGSQLATRLPDLSRIGSSITDMILGYEMNVIYESTWFTRMWIVQEVALASEAKLCCGKNELDWACFAIVMSLLKSELSYNNFDTRSSSAFLRACSVVEARAMFQSLSSPVNVASTSQSQRFGSIVDTMRGQQCKDDRDRIYALLSLQPPDMRVGIEPDYSKPVTQVFVEYALKSLEQGHVEALYEGGAWAREDTSDLMIIDGQEFLPSWVSDIRKANHRRPLPWLKHASSFQSSMCGEFSLKTPYAEGLTLTIEVGGFIFDELVEGRGARLPLRKIFTADQPETFKVTQEHVKACRVLFQRRSHGDAYPTGEDLETAFWSALVMDGNTQNMPSLLGSIPPTPAILLQLGRLYERHCLDDNGEVSKHSLVDLWLNTTEMKTYENLSLEGKGAAEFYNCIRETLDSVMFIVTGKGLIGLAPPGTKRGDLVAIIHGAAYPFIVRSVPGALFYKVVGPCYVHGIMSNVQYDGEPSTITLI